MVPVTGLCSFRIKIGVEYLLLPDRLGYRAKARAIESEEELFPLREPLVS